MGIYEARLSRSRKNDQSGKMYVVSVTTAQALKKSAPGTEAREDSSVERALGLLPCLSPETAKRGHTRLSWWPQSVRAHPPSPSLAPEAFWTHSPWQPHQSVDSGRRPPRGRSRRRPWLWAPHISAVPGAAAVWRQGPCWGLLPVHHFVSSPARASQPGCPPDRNGRCSARRRGRRGCGGLLGAAGGCGGSRPPSRQREHGRGSAPLPMAGAQPCTPRRPAPYRRSPAGLPCRAALGPVRTHRGDTESLSEHSRACP